MRLRPLLFAGAAAVLCATLTATTTTWASAIPAAVEAAPPVIDGAAPMVHLRKLQDFADANGGTRAHGRPGFKASVDYIKATLDAAGYQTTLQEFTYNGAKGWNVIADWPYGDDTHVIMVGAHVDSVPAGPGINDDGSGVADLLENALTVSKAALRPDKRMRFGFWGAEELGLVGSKYYTSHLAAADRPKIEAYLNFDMVGMKNTKKWGIYQEGPQLNKLFKDYFASRNIPTATINPQGMSDHAAFSQYGIAVTGIGSDADLNHLDPCYHKACDTIANVDAATMGISANAVATVLWQLAGAKTFANQ